jgi:hypothetical protein
LLENSRQTIADDGGNSEQTPVLLLATAGMRLLPEADQTRIYQTLQTELLQQPFASITLKTIPGWQEAAFAWLSVNYLEDNLATDPQKAPQTQGILEMGGASTQIAFATTSERDDVHDLQVGKHHYRLVAKSFLGLGQDQALSGLTKLPAKPTAIAACMPTDYTFSINGVLGKGHYDKQRCQQLVKRYVQNYHLPKQVGAIDTGKEFVALSGYYFVFHFFAAKANLHDLEAATEKTCHIPWRHLRRKFPQEDPQWLAKRCFESALYQNILSQQQGYGFDDSQPRLQVRNKIHQQPPDWALGAALYALAGKEQHS